MSSSSSDTTVAAPAGGSVGTLAYGRQPTRVPLFTADAWAPLKVELFRSLWIATLIAQIGTWAREAAGPTLMQDLTTGWKSQPEMVARVTVFSNLPICLLSVFAGALADVLDRRQWLIITQIWMIIVSAVLGILTIAGVISPWLLLAMTFFLSVGTAAFGPALQAVLPELVPKQNFSLAINMNSVALNVARAVGPALFIFVVAIVPGRAGAGLSFLLTAVSFVGAAWVLWQWKRPPQRAAVHGEAIWSGIRAGFRYTIHSPANRAILLRVLTFIVPAVVLWAQVPIIATRQLHMTARQDESSALLFAFVGIGAVLGVFLMPGLHGRYKIDPVVNVCTALFALGLILLSVVHTIWIAAFILMFLGLNWVIIPTNFNTATQKSVPPWVKGRAISFYLTVLFGSFAIGGAIWGRVSTHLSISTALFLGGLSMGILLLLAFWFPLTLNEGLDLSPVAAGPKAPEIGTLPVTDLAEAQKARSGPVDFTIEYAVEPARAEEFNSVMRKVAEQRRRCGAARWKLTAFRDDGCIRFTERFRFHSAGEFERHPARMTQSDLKLLETAQQFHIEPEGPRTHGADPADWPDSSAILKTRFLAQLEVSFNRTLDEIERAADRFAVLTERRRRSPKGIRITIEVPGTTASNHPS